MLVLKEIIAIAFTCLNLNISKTNDLNFEKYNIEQIIKQEDNFEKEIKKICLEHDMNYLDILAIAEIESNRRNIIGDKHLSNKAYGYFQLRQTAIDEVNRIYGFSGIKKANELINNEKAQIKYCVLILKYLKSKTNTEREYISAYNMGLSSVKAGKTNKYYSKFLKARKELES